MDEVLKDWMESALRTMNKAWQESDKNTVTVEFVPEEFHALQDALALALEL